MLCFDFLLTHCSSTLMIASLKSATRHFLRIDSRICLLFKTGPSLNYSKLKMKCGSPYRHHLRCLRRSVESTCLSSLCPQCSLLRIFFPLAHFGGVCLRKQAIYFKERHSLFVLCLCSLRCHPSFLILARIQFGTALDRSCRWQ